MNEENNAMIPQGGDIAKMQEYFSNLKNSGNGKKINNGLKGEDILKKMFVPRNPTELFRILPVEKISDITVEAYFHVIKVQTVKGTAWKKIYCPKHNDDLVPVLDKDGNPQVDMNGKPVMKAPHCALCEKSQSILSQQDKSLIGIKKEDLSPEQKNVWERNSKLWQDGTYWQAKKFHIIKGIDRGIEKDGVKFWRFKDNRKQQGVLDKLIPALSDFMSYQKVLFCDKDKGTDISITVSDLSMPNNPSRTYKDVSAINTRNSSPLSHDPMLAEQWLNDKVTWRDVFKKPSAPAVTTEQLYELIAEGNTPYWNDTDPKNKHWVFPNHPELQEKANTRDLNLDAKVKESTPTNYVNTTINNVTPQHVETQVTTPELSVDMSTISDDDFDDLPF